MLITAGCGISQQSFERWRTWPFFCDITHKCKHTNIGIPAAGNNLIRKAVLNKICTTDVKVCIITWTSLHKADFFIENPDITKEISTYELRNFVVDLDGTVKREGTGYWPSSVGTENRIKKWYTENIQSKYNDYYEFLENICIVQLAAKAKNIKLHMFFSYPYDLEYIKAHPELQLMYDQIDFSCSVLDILDSVFPEYKKYQQNQDYGLVPVQSWHYAFHEKYIMNILDQYYERSNTNTDKLRESCLAITEKHFKNGIS